MCIKFEMKLTFKNLQSETVYIHNSVHLFLINKYIFVIKTESIPEIYGIRCGLIGEFHSR